MGLVGVKNPITDKITEVISSKAQLRKSTLLPDKTFFPINWTIDEILKNAQEALLNITRIPLPQGGGRRTLIGKK